MFFFVVLFGWCVCVLFWLVCLCFVLVGWLVWFVCLLLWLGLRLVGWLLGAQSGMFFLWLREELSVSVFGGLGMVSGRKKVCFFGMLLGKFCIPTQSTPPKNGYKHLFLGDSVLKLDTRKTKKYSKNHQENPRSTQQLYLFGGFGYQDLSTAPQESLRHKDFANASCHRSSLVHLEAGAVVAAFFGGRHLFS